MTNIETFYSDLQAILANPVFYGALAFFIIAIGVVRRLIDAGLFSGLQRLIIRLAHSKKKPLTTATLERRNKIRAELRSRLSSADHIEVIFSDAIRGGYTYERNTKFLGFFKRYRYQRVYITQVFDDTFYASTSLLQNIKYNFLRGKWLPTTSGGEDAIRGYFSGRLRLDHIVYIDWDTDDSPTLYYNPPLFRMFDEEFYLDFKDGEYYPYHNRSWSDVGYLFDSWARSIQYKYYSNRNKILRRLRKYVGNLKSRLRAFQK